MNRPLSRTAHARILAAACEVISRVGADRFSVDEVVRRSGVAKTTIYRHFSNAGRLLIAALDEMIECPTGIDTGTLEGDLDALLDQYLPILNDDGRLLTILSVLRAAQEDDQLREVHREMVATRVAPAIRAIERAQARGDLDPAIEIDMALSLIEGPLMIRRLMSGEPISRDDARRSVELALRALAPHP